MTIPSIPQPAVPYDSWIVASGATGFIGSHVAEQLIIAGYRVRGTTRNAQKGVWLQQYFNEKHGAGKFELREVRDMAAPDAFDEVVKGADGFIHVANDMSKKSDADSAIQLAVDGALNALRAAAGAGLNRFVYTSSSFAATQPKPNKVFTIPIDAYNEEAVDRCKQPNPDGETIYAASKVAADKAIFQWVKENETSIVVNSILPNGNVGPIISPSNQGYPTSARWVKALCDRDYDAIKGAPAQYFVNVQDDARLHVIALAHPEVQSERIFAVTGPVSMPAIIEVLRGLRPDQHWDDWPDDSKDLSTFEGRDRAERLHKDAYGMGFIDLLESVKGNAKDLLG